MRRLFVIGAVVLLLGCSKEGPMGPQGPAGPQGPQGPPGPAGAVNRADFTGTMGASGAVTVPLPAGAVANNRVPVVACYISDTRQTWLAVAQLPGETDWPFCGLTGIGTSSPGVRLINVPSGFFYYIIAAW